MDFAKHGLGSCEKVGRTVLISCNQSSRPATDPIRLLLRSLFSCNPKVASLWNHSVRKDQYLKGQFMAVFSKEEVKSWLKPWSIQGLYSLDSCYESLCYDPNVPQQWKYKLSHVFISSLAPFPCNSVLQGEFYPRVYIICYQGQPPCLGVVGLVLVEYVAVCILALGLATSCIYCFLMLGSSTSGSFGAIGSISSWILSTVSVSDFQSDHWSFA